MDWLRFLEENRIHYVSRGPNTKKGEVSIQCPMCGEDDPSEHMGISLQNNKWGCHRDASHRGKSPQTLIKALLSCSSKQAYIIVKQYSHSDPDSLEAALTSLEEPEESSLPILMSRQKLELEFEDFNRIKHTGVTRKFYMYLQGRGFPDPSIIIQKFNLRCALTGKYQDRVIIPIYLNKELLGWTSRAIGHPINAPRYLASNEDVKTTVLNYDKLKTGGKRLFIVEGPFDALKMDGHDVGSGLIPRATCTFGTSFTISQIALLRNLASNFDETWILFDRGADGPAVNLAEWLGPQVKIAILPSSKKDPGEMNEAQLNCICYHNFDGYFFGYGIIRNLPNYYTQPNVFLKKTGHKP